MSSNPWTANEPQLGSSLVSMHSHCSTAKCPSLTAVFFLGGTIKVRLVSLSREKWSEVGLTHDNMFSNLAATKKPNKPLKY